METPSHHEWRGEISHQESASDRQFGLTFSGLFLTSAFYFWFQKSWMGLPLSVVGIVFGVIGFLASHWLAPMNRLWTLLGTSLAKVTNPVILGVFFYFFLTPFAIFYRLSTTKSFNKIYKRKMSSWIIDKKESFNMENQF